MSEGGTAIGTRRRRRSARSSSKHMVHPLPFHYIIHMLVPRRPARLFLSSGRGLFRISFFSLFYTVTGGKRERGRRRMIWDERGRGTPHDRIATIESPP